MLGALVGARLSNGLSSSPLSRELGARRPLRSAPDASSRLPLLANPRGRTAITPPPHPPLSPFPFPFSAPHPHVLHHRDPQPAHQDARSHMASEVAAQQRAMLAHFSILPTTTLDARHGRPHGSLLPFFPSIQSIENHFPLPFKLKHIMIYDVKSAFYAGFLKTQASGKSAHGGGGGKADKATGSGDTSKPQATSA